jgi:hypothetical protein
MQRRTRHAAAVLATLVVGVLPVRVFGRAAPPARGPEPSPERAEKRAGPVRVLLLGDSLIATELGVELQRLLDETPGYACKRRARSATGLARQDVFDWIRAARLAVAQRRPELVAVMIGSNDAQDVVPPPRRRRRRTAFARVNWEKPGWGTAYRARVGALLDEVTAPGREVLWLELPPMRSRSLDRKLRRVRQAQRAALLARPGDADFLELLSVMKNVGTATLTWQQHWRRLRRDGVHFGRRGSRLLAELILPVIHAMAPRVYLHRFVPRPGPPPPKP